MAPVNQPAVASSANLPADAGNRALRSFLQGIAIDIGVAVAFLVYQVAASPEPIVWAIIGASVLKTVAQAGAAYVMRRFLDPSKFPTPLPPAPVPLPANVDGVNVEQPAEVAGRHEIPEDRI